MNLWQEFHGPNAGYVPELYERYRHNPDSVDAATRALFTQWKPPLDGETAAPTAAVTPAIHKIVSAVNLAQAIRGYGHLAAQLDPREG